MNKGLVSDDDRISSVYCLVVLFSLYSLLETETQLHFIHFKIRDSRLFCDRDDVNLTNVTCGAAEHQFEQVEWFLKGPYSWRKPDFGEKSYLWLAFFNLWNRRTEISSVEYLWFYLSLFVLQSFYRCSTCASSRRSLSNLFVCWFLSKLFPVNHSRVQIFFQLYWFVFRPQHSE